MQAGDQNNLYASLTKEQNHSFTQQTFTEPGPGLDAGIQTRMPVLHP